MGPLSGIRVLEFEAIGPGPFAGMLLADMGADVLVVDRPAAGDVGLKRERWYDVLMRGKRSVTLDLKADSGKEAAQVQRYRSEEHTSELQSRLHLVCRLLLEKKKQQNYMIKTAHVRHHRH